ncbi:MAG: methionyl-tRNA formyltransferase [Lachnospiraceae bacterium]|nr:methionyl-tRNA formyltransferase [Lachnospiraceae bacterium]
MKIVFMGTPDFSVGVLEHIIAAGHTVTAVVTQPDKPKGRSKELQMSPVKECALKHNLTVFQPERIKRPEAVAELRKFEADIFVVVAFGQIISKEILEMPRLGCVNIHASLLPKYRGAAPIQYAVINGDQTTGVTIMQMDEGVDTGDILLQREIPITGTDTGESMFDKLAVLGAELIVEALPLIEQGKLTPVKQDENLATHVGMIPKEMGKINWNDSADRIEHLVRGLNSWPSAFTRWNGKQLKIWKSEIAADTDNTETADADNAVEPGTIINVEKDSFSVQTGLGSLKLLEVQLEGKKRVSVKDFLLGYKLENGMKLGE